MRALDRFVEAMFSTDVYSRMVQPQGDSYAMLLLGKLILLFQSGWLILLLGAMSTLIFGVRRNLRLAFGCFLLMAIVLLVIVGKMLSLAGEYRSVKSLAAMLLERLGPADLVIHEGPLENSAGLTFYTGRQIHVVDGRRGGLHFGSCFPDTAGLFLDGEGL